MNSAIPIHGGNVSAEAQRLGVKEDQLLDASASLVPFLPPNKLRRYLQKDLFNGRIWPDFFALSTPEDPFLITTHLEAGQPVHRCGLRPMLSRSKPN